MKQQLIQQAIQSRKILEFMYHGYSRVVEPHILGVNKGVVQVLGYQIHGGSSSGRLPDWRRFDLREIQSLSFPAQTFTGPRDAWSGHDSDWDYKITVVR